MKQLTEKINEAMGKIVIDDSNYTSMFLESGTKMFTIDNTGKNPKFKSKIIFSWDPYEGFYFYGLESDLKILAEYIHENTAIMEY